MDKIGNELTGSIEPKLDKNLDLINQSLGKSSDFICKSITLNIHTHEIKGVLCYIDGIVDENIISNQIVTKILEKKRNKLIKSSLEEFDIIQFIESTISSSQNIIQLHNMDEFIDHILGGDSGLLLDGYSQGVIIFSKGGETRQVETPTSEINLRGPKEGFTESLRKNTALLRRHINNSSLIFENMKVGEKTNTNVTIAYIQGVADDKVIQEVKYRLSKIKTETILSSGYVEQFIDSSRSLFSTIGNSEKPDKVASKLLEGRVGIICDGTPFVSTVPYLFIEAFQVPDDYYFNPYYSSFMRIIRILSFIISIFVPAVYVALETFHHEMIPSILLLTMVQAREGIPFPTVVETLLMLFIFEVLRESGLRLPRSIGQTVSIVGTLIIGEAAVDAGFISAPMVIIGALTGITSFVTPALLEISFFLRILLVISSGVLGFYGLIVSTMLVLGYMCSLRTFNTPYLFPLAPFNTKAIKDSIIRAPFRKNMAKK